KILMRFPSSSLYIQDEFIDLQNVLNVELSINNNTVYKAGSIASLAGAAIGGLTFGGAGAIVGALTSGRIKKGNISSLALKLRMNDTSRPLIEINFINKPAKSSNKDVIAKMKIAEEYYTVLESRYLRQGILDIKKINRLLKLGDIPPRELEGIVDFSDFIDSEKDKAIKKERHYDLNKKEMIRNKTFRGSKKKKLEKEYRLTRRYDKKILDLKLKIKDYIKY
ncbi:glycine zipper family protein, partial [Thermodesulfobacteriota bacterium]